MKKTLIGTFRWLFLIFFLAGMICLFLKARDLASDSKYSARIQKVFSR